MQTTSILDGQITSTAATDVGCVRRRNEDSFYVNDAAGLHIVADGMGGHLGGNVASGMVTEYLPRFLLKQLTFMQTAPRALLGRFLVTQIQRTSACIHTNGLQNAALSSMGSTLVLTFIRPPWAYIANMGDSRIYLLRKDTILQVSEDHSTVNALIKRGELTPAQARVHPARHMITRYVGMDGSGRPDVAAVQLRPGDRFLLCSDGLTDMLEDSEIHELILQNRSARRGVHALVDAAKNAGGYDNITVVLVDYHFG